MAHQQVAVTDDGDRNMDADECDATKMTLTPEETARAIEVKDMVESLDHINNLTDMEYAQFALTSKPDTCVDKIVDCIYKLQCFREEYRIQDTIEEGAQLMRELMLSQPGYILSVDFAPKFRTYIYVFDFAAFDPSKIKSRHEWKVFMGGTYYIFKCLTTNLQAIREGVVFITECDGMQSGNFDWQLEEKFMHELMHNFPFRYKECLWLNTPTAANIAYSFLKPLVGKDFLSTWRIGCKLEGYDGRIDALFKMPTMEIAQEMQIRRLARFLDHRKHNESTFRLSRSASQHPLGEEDSATTDQLAIGEDEDV